MESKMLSSQWIKVKAVLIKGSKMNSKPTLESFPELVDLLLWFRFFLGIFYGLYLGLNGIRSATLPLQGLNLIAFLPIMYTNFYLGVDSESFGMKLIFSGTFNALALCMLIWLYLYTAANEGDGLRMAALLVSSTFKGDGTDALGSAVPVDGDMTAAQMDQEPEF
jgi:hypothetical protein